MTTYDIGTTGPAELVELKQAHRRTWASGSYATVAERLVDDVPPRHLLERVPIEPGMEVLDLATGTGNVAIRAAQRGARVTGLDLTPELLDRARERAVAAGVQVEWVVGDVEDLPFEDGRFDVVLDRHESYVAAEVFRVLRPGGAFVTQQVDGRDFEETHALFGGTPVYSHVTLETFRAEAETAGFVVEDGREWSGTMRFADVATFVSYVRMVPWEVPDDFSVDRYADALLAMTEHDLVFTRRMFVLVCRRPGP